MAFKMFSHWVETQNSELLRLSPVVELKARSPVGSPEQRLNGTGQVDKQVAHEKKPKSTNHTESLVMQSTVSNTEGKVGRLPAAHMERMGATLSREAMRIPISQIPTVSRRAQVGSPFLFP